MEILEKSPEAIKKEEKRAEKKPERKLKLPEEAARQLNRVFNCMFEKGICINLASTDFSLEILSRDYLPSSKYNKILKGMLFDALDAGIKDKTSGVQRFSEEYSGYLHKSFDEFFSPLVNKEENEEKLEELNEEKHGLVGELEKINKYQLTSKSQKKEKVAPIEMRLLELSRLRKQLEEKLRSPDVLLEFIPGYRKDFEEFEEGLHKTFVPAEQIKQKEKDFRENWVEEKLNKKLEKLRKDLEGLL